MKVNLFCRKDEAATNYKRSVNPCAWFPFFVHRWLVSQTLDNGSTPWKPGKNHGILWFLIKIVEKSMNIGQTGWALSTQLYFLFWDPFEIMQNLWNTKIGWKYGPTLPQPNTKHPPGQTTPWAVHLQWTVRILLECILVCWEYCYLLVAEVQ